MSKTIDYYNQNALAYVNSTLGVPFTDIQERFASHLIHGGRILDFGCGSGRDTKYFLSKGYYVDAIDGSEELCKIASQITGIEVKQCLFEDFTAENEIYDGVWACSSILHLPKSKLLSVMRMFVRVVKNGGYIYASFKYGEFEGVRNGRYFTFFTEDSFQEFLECIEGIEIVDQWVNGDVRPGREEEKWLNVVLKRNLRKEQKVKPTKNQIAELAKRTCRWWNTVMIQKERYHITQMNKQTDNPWLKKGMEDTAPAERTFLISAISHAINYLMLLQKVSDYNPEITSVMRNLKTVSSVEDIKNLRNMNEHSDAYVLGRGNRMKSFETSILREDEEHFTTAMWTQCFEDGTVYFGRINITMLLDVIQQNYEIVRSITRDIFRKITPLPSELLD